MRKLLFAAALAILAWAAVVVPVPLLTLEPVPAMPVADIIDMDEATPPDDVLFTAVQVRQTTTAGSIVALLDEERDVTFAPVVIPSGVEPEEFTELQQRLFEESVRAAAAVGQQAAGRDVTIDGDGARIVRIVPGTPAERVLEQGDVITAVDDRDIVLASDVVSALGDAPAGTEVELTVRRGDEEVTETLVLAELSATGQPGIGVLLQTLDLRIEMPVEVTPASETRVGGQSAGLMIALAVHDALAEEAVVGDRVVAGTGSIDTSGNVGRVSGVAEKVRGAVQADADVFLVPEEQVDEARAAAPEGLQVVAVGTLDEAIEALRG